MSKFIINAKEWNGAERDEGRWSLGEQGFDEVEETVLILGEIDAGNNDFSEALR